MKKILSLFILGLLIIQTSFSGGLVTNTNQSALFVRMLARNASTGIDAVYFNPAGLVKMKNGLYLSVHNQTIFQTKTITNNFSFLNNAKYIGDVKAPIYPSAFGVFKKGKLAVSFGFGVIGGGGSAVYDTGLPSFETTIATVPTILSQLGVPTKGYGADINFDGSSVYYGAQIGLSYAINKMIAISVGGRYISAKNTYNGGISSVMIDPMHPLINPNGGMMPATQFFTLAKMPEYAAMLGDKNVEATQTGTAFTPIFGINLSPMKKLNIGVRYEMATELELENETTVDDTGMFPDKAVTRNDLPALFGAGFSYYVTKKLKTSLSYTTYFDKDADWGGIEKLIDKNSSDLSVGFEYLVNRKLIASIGYSLSTTGVMEAYQTDLSYSLGSNSIGFGFSYRATKKLSIDLGALFVMYDTGEHTLDYGAFGPATETLEKTTTDIGIGITYKLF